MSMLITPVSPTAQAKGKQDAFALVLILVVICLSNLVLVLTSETFARAVELTGQY